MALCFLFLCYFVFIILFCCVVLFCFVPTQGVSPRQHRHRHYTPYSIDMECYTGKRKRIPTWLWSVQNQSVNIDLLDPNHYVGFCRSRCRSYRSIILSIMFRIFILIFILICVFVFEFELYLICWFHIYFPITMKSPWILDFLRNFSYQNGILMLSIIRNPSSPFVLNYSNYYY